MSLLQNNEPFKYLEITSCTDDDQKHQVKPMLSARKEGSRLLSDSPFKTTNQNYISSRISTFKIHYTLSCTLYMKNIYQHQYPPWGTTKPNHLHFALNTTSTQVSN